jgi:protein-disulfide isomerase
MSIKPQVSEYDHIEGRKDAPVELVEYGDYQCPYCGEAYPIVKFIQKQLGNNLRFVFRNFPLKNIHPDAVRAAIASEAAGLQGKYWQMHDLLFENQKRLNPHSLLGYAKELNLNMDQFEADLVDQRLEKKVLDDFYNGLRRGVNATPTFFINGEKYNDDWRSKKFLEFLQINAELH